MKKINLFYLSLLIILVIGGNFSLPFLASGKNSKGGLAIVNQYAVPAKSQSIKLIEKNYVPGEIIVKYKNNKISLNTSSGRVAAANFIKSRSLEKKEDLRKNNISVLKILDSKTVEQKIAELKNDQNVEYAEPNYLRYISEIATNDPDKNKLWGLDNTGQTVQGTYSTDNPGSNDKDIDAPEAWAINEGTNTTTIVAVLDTGVAYNHPDLIDNMWDGTNCKDENGAFLGGCNHGYDFEDNDNKPLPTSNTHGTHVAGIIAAAKNNSKGIIGVAPKAKIMALKFGLDTASEIKAIDFAIQNGAKVINASYGGATFSQAEYDAINRFKTAGGIFVAAAGNDSTNNEASHFYPSDYNLDNIISVAATDQKDILATFSNYGTSSVDVAAPGVNIYSSVPNETVSLSETFEEVTASSTPIGWVKGGVDNNWGTYYFNYLDPNDNVWGNVLYSDLAYPYANNANTTITSPAYDLSTGTTTGASIDFWTQCDTEYITDGWADYMQLEYSSDGINFSTTTDPYSNVAGEWFRWDEATLDILNGDPLVGTNSAVFHYANISIPDQYLTGNFKFRLRWITNSADNNYDACFVDNIRITKYSDGSDEKYAYKNGTSMAAPHVSGLAALIFGYAPLLSNMQVKEAILASGDDLASSSKNTVTNKRINAYNALNSIDVTSPSAEISYSDTDALVKAGDSLIITANFNEPIADSPVMQIAISGANTATTTNMTKASSTQYTYTHLVGAGDGLATLTLHTGKDIAGNIVTSTPISGATFTVDNTAPLNQDTVFAASTTKKGVDSVTIASSGEVNNNIWFAPEGTSIFIESATTTKALNGTSTSILAPETEGNYRLYVVDAASNISSSSVAVLSVDNTAPTVTKIGDDSSDVILASGETNLVFSEILATSSKMAVEEALVRGANNGVDETLSFSWSGAILIINANATTTFINDVIVNNVSDLIGNSTTSLLLIDSNLSETQTVPNESGAATSSTATPQVVLINPNLAVTLTVNSGTTNPTLDLSSFINSHGTGTLPAINIISANTNNFRVNIATTTIVTSASTTWNGIITAPKTSSVTLPETSGQTKTLSTAIEIGVSDFKLSFDKAVKLLFPGQANKRAGYIRTGISFTEITTTCSENSQTWADANLGVDGDCKVNSGSDLVIWTKHFTSFATYSQTTNNTGGNNNNNNSGGGGGGGSVTYCSTVVYSPWQNCVGALQVRTVLTSTPASCSLTTTQQLETSRICELATSTEVILNQATSSEVIIELIDSAGQNKISLNSRAQTAKITAEEKNLTIKIDLKLIKRLAGRILLQVEEKGQAWYLEALSLKRYYLADGPSAYEALRKFGLGIKNSDLDKIPVASGSALPPGQAVNKSINLTSLTDSSLINRLKGRIVIQTERRGEAWYINPADGKRSYLANGEEAYKIMRYLSLGINDLNIRKITVGSWE